MPIRWNASKVSDGLDEMERLLGEAEPLLRQMEAKAEETSELPKVPEYISQPLKSLAWEMRERLDRYRQRIESIKGHIPEDALKKHRSRDRKSVV